MHLLTTLLPVLLAATRVSAVGCSTHTYTACADGITHWYDPDDGQICDPLDCGGGRAPPKSNVPCCPSYTGTLSCDTSPSYLPCFKNLAQSTVMSSTAKATTVATTTAQASSAVVTGQSSAASGGQAVSSGASPTAPVISPPSTVGGVPTGANATQGSATASQKPIVTGNAANAMRYSPLVGIAGAAVLML